MDCVGPTLSKKNIQRLAADFKFTPEIDEAAELLSLAGNDTRLKILYLLAELKSVCVCDLAEILTVSVSAVSQQLAKLKAYGLVKNRREAQTIYYSLSAHPFIETLKRSTLSKLSV